MTGKVQYPTEPPAQPPKSILKRKPGKPGQIPKDLGLWLTHDPAIYQDETTGYYYIYGTNAICQKSKDLIHWEMVGKVIPEPSRDAEEWVGTKNIWAPDIVKVGDEYRLYASNSSWGVRQSCIFLAVADNPEGPFEPRQIVLKTSNEVNANAIDANIITDVKTGEMYMLYGSFWGGCHIIKLDKETGLAAEGGLGICLASRPSWLSTAVEGPYMIYNPDTDYYYLFVSYGSLKTDYQIRVGRSKYVTGPFVDHNGKEMTDPFDPGNNIGLMQMCGYSWNDGTAYMGPGHNSVLHDKDGSWYMVCHIREKNYKDTNKMEPSTMQIRKMFWTKAGWPVVSPEPYAGEIDQEIPLEEVLGKYERINLAYSLPQGVQSAVPMKLDRGKYGDYYECCSIQGQWEYKNGRFYISYGPHKEEAFVTAVWDAERNCPTIGLAGLSEEGVPFWAKKRE